MQDVLTNSGKLHRMDYPTTLQKIVSFFLTKIIIGVLIVGASVVLVESAGRSLLEIKSMLRHFIISEQIGLKY
jgi:hypothetical protein